MPSPVERDVYQTIWLSNRFDRSSEGLAQIVKLALRLFERRARRCVAAQGSGDAGHRYRHARTRRWQRGGRFVIVVLNANSLSRAGFCSRCYREPPDTLPRRDSHSRRSCENEASISERPSLPPSVRHDQYPPNRFRGRVLAAFSAYSCACSAALRAAFSALPRRSFRRSSYSPYMRAP